MALSPSQPESVKQVSLHSFWERQGIVRRQQRYRKKQREQNQSATESQRESAWREENRPRYPSQVNPEPGGSYEGDSHV
jgi:hypothetical protein